MKKLIQLYNQFTTQFLEILLTENPEFKSWPEKLATNADLYSDFQLGKFTGSFGMATYESPNPTTLEHFIKKYTLDVHDDITLFWLTMTSTVSGSVKLKDKEDKTGFFGFDFYTIKNLEKDIDDFRKLAEITEGLEPDHSLHRIGIPLSYSDSQLIYLPSDGKIYYAIYDGKMPELPIADSFKEFFEHYLASGCFLSHSFKPHWELVKDIVPIKIPISENKWLQFYKKTYQNKTDIE